MASDREKKLKEQIFYVKTAAAMALIQPGITKKNVKAGEEDEVDFIWNTLNPEWPQDFYKACDLLCFIASSRYPKFCPAWRIKYFKENIEVLFEFIERINSTQFDLPVSFSVQVLILFRRFLSANFDHELKSELLSQAEKSLRQLIHSIAFETNSCAFEIMRKRHRMLDLILCPCLCEDPNYKITQFEFAGLRLLLRVLNDFQNQTINGPHDVNTNATDNLYFIAEALYKILEKWDTMMKNEDFRKQHSTIVPGIEQSYRTVFSCLRENIVQLTSKLKFCSSLIIFHLHPSMKLISKILARLDVTLCEVPNQL